MGKLSCEVSRTGWRIEEILFLCISAFDSSSLIYMCKWWWQNGFYRSDCWPHSNIIGGSMFMISKKCENKVRNQILFFCSRRVLGREQGTALYTSQWLLLLLVLTTFVLYWVPFIEICAPVWQSPKMYNQAERDYFLFYIEEVCSNDKSSLKSFVTRKEGWR